MAPPRATKDKAAAAAPSKAAAAPSKAAPAKDKAKEKKQKTTKAGDNFLYVVVGACVALAAVLIGTVHAMKRARRAARARGPVADEPPAWVISERAMLLGVGVLFVLGACVSVGIVYGAQISEAVQRRRKEASERAEAKRLAAQKAADKAAREKAAAEGREAAGRRDAEERKKQAEFEGEVLASIRATKEREKEAAAAVRQARAEELAAAQREAARIDEVVRLAALKREEADDGWEVGDYDGDDGWGEGEGGEVGEDGGGDGEDGEGGEGAGYGGAGGVGGADDDDDGGGAAEDRMPLELHPVARGTRLSLEALAMPKAATARLDAAWLELSCSRCGERSELVLSGLHAHAAEKKGCDAARPKRARAKRRTPCEHAGVRAETPHAAARETLLRPRHAAASDAFG